MIVRNIKQIGCLAFLLLLLSPLLLAQSAVNINSLAQQARRFTRFREFDYIEWTLGAMWQKAAHSAFNLPAYTSEQQASQLVLDAMRLIAEVHSLERSIQQIYADPEVDDPTAASQALRQDLTELQARKDWLVPMSESILQHQIGVILAEKGLAIGGHPFPPILYKTTPLPKAMIISPRYVIRREVDVSIEAEMPLNEVVELEDIVSARLDVSTLVTNIGGVGTYPNMLLETSDLVWLIGVVSHEWTHNYLTLRPLGISYGTSDELRTINETTAFIVEEEVRWAVIERFYPHLLPPPPPPGETAEETIPAPADEEIPPFNFDLEMYLTRTRVDELLAAGKIEEAEAYMEARRLFFNQNGFRLRRLNQAFFAFHSAYVFAPSDGEVGQTGAAGTDPVGPAVWQLRERSPSLADFVRRVSWVTSFEQLKRSIEN